MPKQYKCRAENQSQGITPCPTGGIHSSQKARNRCNSSRNPFNGISLKILVKPPTQYIQKVEQNMNCQQVVKNFRGRVVSLNKAMNPAIEHGNVQRQLQFERKQSRYPGWQTIQFNILNSQSTPYQYRVYVQKAVKWFNICKKMFAIRETRNKMGMSSQETEAYYQSIINAIGEYYENYKTDQFLGLRKTLTSQLLTRFQLFLSSYKSIEKIQLECNIFSNQMMVYWQERQLYMRAYNKWFQELPKTRKNKKSFESVYQMETRFQHRWKMSFYKRNPQYYISFEKQIKVLQGFVFENLQTLQICAHRRKIIKERDVLSNYLVDGKFPTYVFKPIIEETDEKEKFVRTPLSSSNKFVSYEVNVDNPRYINIKRLYLILNKIMSKRLEWLRFPLWKMMKKHKRLERIRMQQQQQQEWKQMKAKKQSISRIKFWIKRKLKDIFRS